MRRFVDAGRDESLFVLQLPNELARHFGVVLFLNGVGENGADGVLQISNNFGESVWEVRRDFPLICVAPQCRENWSVASPDMVRAMAILDEVMQEYDVDPDRIYLTGVSAGADAVGEFVAAYPGKFAAVVPVSATCGLSAPSVVRSLSEQNVAVWNISNDGDAAKCHHAARERLLDAGLSPIFTGYRMSHHDAWTAGYRNAAMYEWLSRQSRTANAQRAAEGGFRRLLVDESGLDEWRKTGPGAWSVAEGILRYDVNGSNPKPERGEEPAGAVSGNNPTSDSAGELVLDAALTDFELHFDYRSPGDAGCEFVLASVDRPDESIGIVIEWPERGTGGVVHEPSGEWLGWSDPLAQREIASGRWNDVRVILREGRLRVSVNGAELHDVTDPRLRGRHRVGLRVPAGANDREWRYVRMWRPLASPPKELSLPSGEKGRG